MIGRLLLLLVLGLAPRLALAACPSAGLIEQTPVLQWPRIGTGVAATTYRDAFCDLADEEEGRRTQRGPLASRPSPTVLLATKVWIVDDCLNASCAAAGGTVKCVTWLNETGTTWLVGPCDGSATLGNDSITPDNLKSTGQTDEFCLTYELTGDGLEWAACGGGGSSIILDLGDNGVNESTGITEIATTGDTNAIFSEPAADKLLIAVGNDWPKADTADDLTCTNCIGATEIDESTLLLQNLGGAVTDAQVPNTLTLDLEASTLTNIADDEMLAGSGAGTATYIALPTGGTNGCAGAADKPLYNSVTRTWTCGTDAGAGGGMTSFTAAGSSGTPQSITDGNTLTVAAALGLTTTAAATDTVTAAFDYGQTLAGNPALAVDTCIFGSTATGGGFLCEGSTANTNEQLYLFPDVDGADTTQEITINTATQTLTNKTIGWTQLDAYPTGCTNQFVVAVGDTLTCATVDDLTCTNCIGATEVDESTLLHGALGGLTNDDHAYARDVYARQASGMNCDGVTDDRGDLNTLLTGSGAGRIVVLDNDCDVFLSAAGADTFALTLPSHTTLRCTGDSALVLTARTCTTGRYAGAACAADGDCNYCGANCSGSTCTGSLYATTGGTNYPVIGAADGTQNVRVEGCIVRTRQVDDYNTWSGGTNAGRPCLNVCSTTGGEGGGKFLNSGGRYIQCDADADCTGGSGPGAGSVCIGLGDAAGGTCTGAPGNPSGPGDINVFDFDGPGLGAEPVIRRARVADVEVRDHRIGDFTAAFGWYGEVERLNTIPSDRVERVSTLATVTKPVIAVTNRLAFNSLVRGGRVWDSWLLVGTGVGIAVGPTDNGIFGNWIGGVGSGGAGSQTTTGTAMVLSGLFSGNKTRVSGNYIGGLAQGIDIVGADKLVEGNIFDNIADSVPDKGWAIRVRGPGSNVTNNGFDWDPTRRRCGSTCSGGSVARGGICTADADCGTCGNTSYQCIRDPIIQVGDPTTSAASASDLILGMNKICCGQTTTDIPGIRISHVGGTVDQEHITIFGNDILTKGVALDLGELHGTGTKVSFLEFVGNHHHFTAAIRPTTSIIFPSAAAQMTGMLLADNLFDATTTTFTNFARTLGTVGYNQGVLVGEVTALRSSIATNDDPTEEVRQCRAATTDATVTTLCSFPVTSAKSMEVRARINAHCTGGGSCSANNSATYTIHANCKNNAGTTVAVTGSPDTIAAAEDVAGWDATIDCDDTSDTARVRITGAASTDITWHATVAFGEVGT